MDRPAPIGPGGDRAIAGLHLRLRSRTRSAHDALDASTALEARLRTHWSYRDLLVQFWGVYATLTEELEKIPLPFPQANKVAWLEADLRRLGLSHASIQSLPRAPFAYAVARPSDAFGVLYVLEGATLGGQVIARRLEATLGITTDCGGRFFCSYGAEVGAHWRRFVKALNAFGETSSEVDRVERAALATFACFQNFIADRDHPPPRGGADHVS